ncbi:MAG: LysM peptidoglycan-binding domain-containing protein [Acidobacteriota bacterium]
MFGPDSRYAQIETVVHVTPDGREISYKRRRLLPRGEDLQMLTAVVVRQGDTLDHLAASTLGNAEQSWRIADANNAMKTRDLLEPDRELIVPVPQF